MPVEASGQIDLNQRALTKEIEGLRSRLEQHAASQGEPTGAEPFPTEPSPQLEILSAAFRLSAFERSVLLLCAAMELDSSFAALCASVNGEAARPYPTFSLALVALAAPHWSALNPAAPLRRWRLIEIQKQTGATLMTSPLRIDERILHFLAGVHYVDDRVAGLVYASLAGEPLVPSYLPIANAIEKAWQPESGQPVVHLCGSDEVTRQSIAAAAANGAGLRMHVLPVAHIPEDTAALETFLRLWERESVLGSAVLYVAADSIDRHDVKASGQVSRLLDLLHAPVFLSSRDPWPQLRRGMKTLEIRKPAAAEQGELWRALLGDAANGLNGHLANLVSQFNLTAPAIRASVAEAVQAAGDGATLAGALWSASRNQARPRMDDLADRIDAKAGWSDLVLPAAETLMLKTIASHVRNRSKVYGSWGFGSSSNRGLGIGALFAGSSGTGKTMAAEVLANELNLDLYRVDLSGVVSKYIGETEKNLRRVFDAAEDGGAILFFDEADALFGKRSEVKDSHDRYANIEVNYLLQRMESYSGLAVLATNMKSALDPAFLRRIRFVVNFPFPDSSMRAEIWKRVFPDATPTEELDADKLARLQIAGGNIRNIALHAAFLAAESGDAVRMRHLAQAARGEFAKIDKPFVETDVGGWA